MFHSSNILFNRARALAFMADHDLDALIATSPVNITYFTDYRCWIDPLFKEYMVRPGASSQRFQAYAVFPRTGPPALVVNPLLAVNTLDLWVEELYVFGDPGLDLSLDPVAGDLAPAARPIFDLLQPGRSHSSATAALLAILQDRGLSGGRLGLEQEGLPVAVVAQLGEALPRAQLRDCTNLIRLIRMVKSPTEMERLTRAAAISEAALAQSAAIAQPGRAMAELAQVYRTEIARDGADFDHFAFAPHGLGIATESHHRLGPQDVHYLDVGCIYRHYFSDSGVTLAMAPLVPALQSRQVALHACVAAGAAAICPGVAASAVQAAMVETLTAHGFSACYPHGHGLGLEIRDYPILAPANDLRVRDDCVDVSSDLPLEVDMVLNLEAPIWVPGVGSLQVEQSFVVTATGSRPLVPQERAQPVGPGA